MKQFKTVWLSLLVIALYPFSVLAADGDSVPEFEEVELEQSSHRMLRQTSDVKGYQPLTVVGQEINAAYLEETLGQRHGAVVLLHDKGEQFEAYGVITPLRHALPQYGWSTLILDFDYPFEANILLSIKDESAAEIDELDELADETLEEPVADATTTELPPVSNQDRIQAALAFLQAKNINRIVFIGHGAGGDMAIELLDTIKTPISALLLVGATAHPKNDVFNEFNFPILDIYGANDLDVVPEAVEHRKTLMKRINNTRYQVRRVEGADHVFSGLRATLIATVSGWLRKQFVEQADN